MTPTMYENEYGVKSIHFWNEMDEYRWEFPHIGQGHYILAKDLDDAKRIARKEARAIGLGNTIVLQKWKPKQGKKMKIEIGEGNCTCRKCGKEFRAVHQGFDLCTSCEDKEVMKGW